MYERDKTCIVKVLGLLVHTPHTPLQNQHLQKASLAPVLSGAFELRAMACI